MRVTSSVKELRGELEPSRREGRSIGFVPTMGALHGGHRALVRAAKAENDIAVLSIFVNPLQFGPSEDFEAYPRTSAADLELAEKEQIDLVFKPSVEDMYRDDATTRVSVGPLGEVLEGRARPGHFDGVCTVVAKLFNIVEPDAAYFGQKDAQQAAVIERMARDLSYCCDIRVCPTVREPDGLAMSSRNSYLSPDERRQATALYRALSAGVDELRAGGGANAAEKKMWAVLEAEQGVDGEYAKVVDVGTFGAPLGDALLLLVAARVGRTRLIDNTTWTASSEMAQSGVPH